MDFSVSFVVNNTPIYRIMPLKRIKGMVEEKRNTLMRPSSWDDPHEMNNSNSVIVTEKGNVPLDASHWFGQCWSLCEESAIMWQAFKKSQEPYVKIKIHAFDLVRELKSKDDGLRISVLGYVRDFNPNISDYEKALKDCMSMHQWPQNFLSKGVTIAELFPLYSLLTKRDVFKHEEEVRLLLFDKSSSESQESISYPFNPDVLKEVVIDPWTSLDDDKYVKIESELREYLPEDKTVIRKSEVFSDSSKFSIRYHIK